MNPEPDLGAYAHKGLLMLCYMMEHIEQETVHLTKTRAAFPQFALKGAPV